MSKTSWAAPMAAACSQAWWRIWSARRKPRSQAQKACSWLPSAGLKFAREFPTSSDRWTGKHHAHS